MSPITLQALAQFPDQLEAHYAAVPARRLSPADLDRTAVFEGYGPLTLRSLVHDLCSHDQQHLAGLQWLIGKIDAAQVKG